MHGNLPLKEGTSKEDNTAEDFPAFAPVIIWPIIHLHITAEERLPGRKFLELNKKENTMYIY